MMITDVPPNETLALKNPVHIIGMNMNKEAYEYMIDKNSCPSWSKPGKWAAMSEKERLEAHLQRTVEHLGGISYTYQVFED